MAKTVFSNSMCAHTWAQLSQPHGRSSSMRFDGALAYSYAEPVAHIVKTITGKHVALFTSRKWSVTTSAHVSDYKSASRQYLQFDVPDLFRYRYQETAGDRFNHEENIAYLRHLYADAFAALMRVPCESYHIANNRAEETLKNLSHDLLRYRDAFGLAHVDSECPWLVDAQTVWARAWRLLNDPKRAAKREAGRLQRERAELKRQEARKEARRIAALKESEREVLWIAGADVYLTRYREGGALLRIRDDIVQTSMGAECPLPHARRALAYYHRVWWRGQPAHTVPADFAEGQLGHFRLDSIDADGNVRAGCHTIMRSELERFAKLIKAGE
jgi:hypothetical protein